ncbi:unnamed protein product [Larinioides sclopetarius]|uniref:Apolipoprotein L3 n=1 Tax=Larinioides sclopetarius TaxID=280406 RepID=A0AAV1YZK2_9ARAC
MNSNQKLFERFFGSNENIGLVVLERPERSIAQLVFDISSRKISEDQEDFDGEPDDDPDNEPSDGDYEDNDYFDEKIETAAKNFNRVVELFKLSSNAKKEFLENFKDWSVLRKNNVRRLKEIANDIQSDKFNSDIAKVVGSVVGVVGGIVAGLSLLTPLAVVTLPLAISGGIATAVGGGVVVGTTVTEVVLLKNKLEEAKTFFEQEKKDFSVMEKWFIHTQELKDALESWIDYSLLNEISKDLKEFENEVNFNLDSLTDKFGNLLTMCIGKMIKQSKIVELFGVVFAPVVMTFVLVVCLIRDHNRLVLDCILEVGRLTAGVMSILGTGVQAGRLTVDLASTGAAAGGRAASVAIATSVFIALGIAIDVVNIVWSSIDIHNCPEPEQARMIKEVAEKLEEQFLFIESVYEELKQWNCIDLAYVYEWKTFIIKNVPHDAVQIDIKMAIKHHLSEEAWGCIKLQRHSIDGNDWLFKIPASHSKMLLEQSHLIVKSESCQITKWNQWKTFILHHVPNEARQDDIKVAVGSHLPEEARGSIHLQKISTDGNNWLVKIPTRHSQNFMQKSHIIVNRERCLVTQ